MTIFETDIQKKHIYPFLYGISKVVDECKLQIRRDCIFVKERDPANVCEINTRLPVLLEIDRLYVTDEPIVFGLDIEKYIKIFTDDDNITDDSVFKITLLDPVDGDSPQLSTVIYNRDIEQVRYTHNTMRIESLRKCLRKSDKSINLVNLVSKLPVEITMPLRFLLRGVKAVERVGSDHVYIGVDFDTQESASVLFIRSFDSPDIATTQIKTSLLPGFNNRVSRHVIVNSLYSIEYLSDIIKGFSEYGIDKNIRLNLGNNMPLIISTVDDISPELSVALAPRVE